MSQLYQNLLNLCNLKSFYFTDQEVDGHTYRIFLYRIASYTEFLLHGAMECRGHTFLLGEEPKLVCRPMEKFFNLGENPMTIDLDLSKVHYILDKLDGSLISTVRTPDGFTLKSKGSFFSEQAVAAKRLLDTKEYRELRNFCKDLCQYTVNMEYTAPDNRIVIGYEKPELKILNVRVIASGRYIDQHILADMIDPKFLVAGEYFADEDPTHRIKSIASMTGIEGFVCRMRDGTQFKVKTDAYCLLHKTKDSITNQRSLFEACLNGQGDDLLSMFKDDPVSVSMIAAMIEKTRTIYNDLDDQLQDFYNQNKHLDRKSYAILGQAKLAGTCLFSLAMNLYIGREANLAEVIAKNSDQFLPKEVEEEAE